MNYNLFLFHILTLYSHLLLIISNDLALTPGERLDGVDSESAAQKLRGPAGTTVTVKVQNVIFYSCFQKQP